MARWRTHHNRRRSAAGQNRVGLKFIRWARGGMIDSGHPYFMGGIDWGNRPSTAICEINEAMIEKISRSFNLPRSVISHQISAVYVQMPDGSIIGGAPGAPGSIAAAADAYRNPLYDQIRRERYRR